MMKEKTIQLALATLLIGGILFLACQKDEPLTQAPETATGTILKSDPIDCSIHCIDPDDPVYCEMEQQETVTWGNPRNPFTKTTDIVYYNTLTHFILRVMGTHGWADLLIDGESVWTQGPVAANEWGQYEAELPAEWEAGNAYNFQLKVAGFGPPAYFDVAYQLIGECVYYTLSLAVYPEGAGTVTGQGEYMEGEEVALTATANEGYVFVNWRDGDDTEISNLPDFTYTMPAMDKTLTAIFEEEEEVFVCGESTITDIDGNVYNTVLIGGQCWMKENLKTTQYRNGTPIEYPGADNSEWVNNTTGAYAWFDNDISWKDSYGALYNWYAVNNAHDLCPAGWHVPSDSEWTDLVNYVVDQGFPNELGNPNGAGNALKSCRQVDSPIGGDCSTSEHPRWDPSDDHHGFDEFGFSAHQGRRRTTTGGYISEGPLGNWWSSTESSSTSVLHRSMHYNRGDVYRSAVPKGTGISVRCVRNSDD